MSSGTLQWKSELMNQSNKRIKEDQKTIIPFSNLDHTKNFN